MAELGIMEREPSGDENGEKEGNVVDSITSRMTNLNNLIHEEKSVLNESRGWVRDSVAEHKTLLESTKKRFQKKHL